MFTVNVPDNWSVILKHHNIQDIMKLQQILKQICSLVESSPL